VSKALVVLTKYWWNFTSTICWHHCHSDMSAHQSSCSIIRSMCQ